MHLVVFSHKDIWPDAQSPTGFVTDGGFPFQMKAVSELADQTTLLLPLSPLAKPVGLIPLVGHQVQIKTLSPLKGRGWKRKARVPFWFLRNSLTMWRAFRQSDAVHAAIPGDVGTVGILLAKLFRKPLFVRYCGNWLVSKTKLERFWKWLMRHSNQPYQVMLATGSTPEPPAPDAPHIDWIFSTSLNRAQMKALRERERHFPGNAPRFVIVGRQEQAKGTGILIRAIQTLLPTYPGCHLDVIGDGSALASFKQIAQELGLSDRITFHGKIPQPKVIEHLQNAHLFVFPTYSSEGFPKVVLEALASGLPVVTTKVSALPMLLANGGGVLMDEASPDACQRAILEALKDSQHYLTLSQQACDIAQNYSLEAWRDKIGEHLKKAWRSVS